MKKVSCSLLLGILFFFIPMQGKPVPVFRISTVSNGGVQEIKMPPGSAVHLFSDSLKIIPHDTVHHKKHRLIAAVLAFPVIGIFGLHRAYLGTSPQIPFIYIVTLGGGLGILPFIDFVMILLSRDNEFHTKYTHNHYIFMWHKK